MDTEEQIRDSVTTLSEDELVRYIVDLQEEARFEGYSDGYDEGCEYGADMGDYG